MQVDVADFPRKIKEELREYSKSHFIYSDELPKGVVMGFKDNTIVVGTKKVFTEFEEVLMEVAKQKLNELEENQEIYESDWCKEELDNSKALFEEAKGLMPSDELKKILLKYNTVTFDFSAAFGESQFTQGYLEGYKFAKQMLENKKERTAATVRSS